MCDDDGHAHAGGPALSRRRVLQGMVALAALAGVGNARPASAAPLPPRSPNLAGLNAYVLGMHLHASASEGTGSMRTQLAQAATNGFDVAWFTEHDWRRRRLLFRPAYHFLAKDVADGGAWTLKKLANVGSLTSASGGQLVTTTASPNDTASSKGSLRLRATSTGAAQGTARQQINADGSSRGNFRSRISGRTVSVDVYPTAGGPNAWAEVLLTLSRQLGVGTRPTGVLSLLYRLRTDVTTRTVTAQGTTGIVDVPVTRGSWQTVVLDLTGDLHAAWPDLDPRDNALSDIEFHAVSRRKALSDHFFSYLRFDETAGYDALGVERDLLAAFAGQVPTVLGLVGTEISLGAHLNQFGGPQDPYDYGPVTSLNTGPGEIRPSIVDFIHAQGGLASINHPFQPGDSSGPTTAQGVALDLLSIGAGGADILEVGYADKGGAGVTQHLAVWDTLSRNGLFLTGTGVSDDHSGTGWSTLKNRFYTGAWSSTLDEPGLLGALGRGGAYVGYLGAFGGTIDMAIDTDVPMGAVSVSPLTSRTLRIDVAGLPEGGAVQVVRGDVDRPGTTDPNPATSVVATLNATDLSAGNERSIDTTDDCFVRLQVIDSSGSVVAFGQPTWVLKTAPDAGIPAARQTAD
ncbi:MAG: hypothetical protein ACXVX0_07160 [Blastococcus sp.]